MPWSTLRFSWQKLPLEEAARIHPQQFGEGFQDIGWHSIPPHWVFCTRRQVQHVAGCDVSAVMRFRTTVLSEVRATCAEACLARKRKWRPRSLIPAKSSRFEDSYLNTSVPSVRNMAPVQSRYPESRWLPSADSSQRNFWTALVCSS